MVNRGQLIWGAMLFALILSVAGVLIGGAAAIVGWISGGIALIVLGLAILKVSAVGLYYTYRWFVAAA